MPENMKISAIGRHLGAGGAYLALSILIATVGRLPVEHVGELTMRPEVALASLALLVFGWSVVPFVLLALVIESVRTPVVGFNIAYIFLDSLFGFCVAAITAYGIRRFWKPGNWGQQNDFLVFAACGGILTFAPAAVQLAFVRNGSGIHPLLIAWVAVVVPMIAILPAGIKLNEWRCLESRPPLLEYLGQGVKPHIQAAQFGLLFASSAVIYAERIAGANGRIYPPLLVVFWMALTSGLAAAAVGLLMAVSLFVAVNHFTATPSSIFDIYLALIAMGSATLVAGGLVSARREVEGRLRVQSETLLRQLAEMQIIRRLADSIIALRDEGALFELGAELIGEQLRADQVWILWVPTGGLPAEERGYWASSTQIGRDRFTPDLCSADLSPIWIDLEQNRKELHSKADLPDSRLAALGLDVTLHQASGIKSLVLHPFSFENTGFYVAGILAYRRFRHWTAEELHFLTAIADQITIALQKTKLLGEREERSRAFARMTQALVADTGQSFFRNLVLRLAEAAGARGAYCSRLDLSGEAVTLIAFADSGKLRKDLKIPVAGSPVETTLKQGWQAIEDNAGQLYPSFQESLRVEIRGFASTALVDSSGTQLGTLVVYDDKPLVDADHVVSVLRLFSARASAEIERSERELLLQESETSYRRLLETAHEGIWIINAEGQTSYVNATMANMLGYSAEELLERRIQDFVDEQDRDRVSLELQRELAGAAAQQDLRFKCRNGSFVWLMLSMSPIRNQQGEFGGALAMATDISERKRTEEELDRLVHDRTEALVVSNRELEAFCYSISHDLRQPLRAIDGFSRAAVEDLGDQAPEDVKEHLARVRRAANRMSELIDALLTLSRLSRVEMKRETVDLTAIAEAIVAELVRTDARREQSYSIRKGLTCVGDARLLHILLENLLSNAWKFSSRAEKPFVEFGMKSNKGVNTFYVRDNGIGFDMAYSGKLFKPFERLHTDSEFYGTGIGLATVWRIVTRHGGDIKAESAVGKGATFYFTIGSEDYRLRSTSALPFADDGVLL
jgi:PAS domain S-box-containing protein